jgi:HlyD family secretion protein
MCLLDICNDLPSTPTSTEGYDPMRRTTFRSRKSDRSYQHNAMVAPTALVILVAVVMFAAFPGCGHEAAPESENRTYILVPVERQDIAVTISAKGVLEPTRVIEIKSKASGEILRMPVEVGETVDAGDLLVQVDTTDVQANHRQKEADLEYRRAENSVAERQRAGADDLLRKGMISSDDHDAAILNFAASRAALVSAETNLDQARERVAETIVRAPITGTILEKSVETGQIIASATSQVTGGTTLMKMADLSVMQVRVLFDARDLSRVRPGLSASVVTDAYPDRTFEAVTGTIIPQPVKKQNMTYFPMTIAIDNREGPLLPGIKCDVEIVAARVKQVLVVTPDAVASVEGARDIARLLDISIDSLDAVLTNPPLNAGVVFLPIETGFRSILVGTGVRTWEKLEITSGLDEGTQIIIPPSAEVARQFREFREMIRKRTRTIGAS